MKAEFVF